MGRKKKLVPVVAIIEEPTKEEPVVAQEVEPVKEEKSKYTIEACGDCGKRRKLYKCYCCIDCWSALEEKREKIRRKCDKERAAREKKRH